MGDKWWENGEKFSQCEFQGYLGDWAGQVDANWMGEKLEVNGECQLLTGRPRIAFSGIFNLLSS